VIRRLPRLGSRRLLVVLGTSGLTALALALWVRLGPIDARLLDLRETTSSAVVDRRGVPLYESLSGDGTRSVHLDARTLPPLLVAATVAAEDRRYWSHTGVDVVAIARAMRHNLSEGRVVEGGSTITQQVAKLLINRQVPKRARGIREKVREAVLALRLEHRYSKDEILALYLNLASYGNQIVGAGKASRTYFATDPAMLTPAQAAFLAGLPQRPSAYPFRNRESAFARQRTVLRRMQASGVLSAAQANEAREERLSFSRSTSPFLAPHFVEMVLAAAGDARPARIATTLDAELHGDVAGIIRSHRAALDRHGAANVAVVVLDNLRGEWMAWEGSGNYADAEHGGAINGAVSSRQPGSALKPFTYALAFESGFTPASVLPDIPSHFPTAEAGVLYSPRNYDGRFRGPLLARRALAGSENVPAVALAADLGVPTLLRFLSRAGLTTFDRTPSYYGLGITLGNAEVRLDQLTAAYSAFARGGEWLEPTWLPGGLPRRERRSLVSTRTAYWITDILSDDAAREYIFGRGGSLEFPFPVAVKTGTSQAYHDNWTIGYTRDVTVGVWVGNFDRTPLKSSTGVTGAAPIFHAVMLAAVRRFQGAIDHSRGSGILPVPEGMLDKDVCALSGMPANAWCPSRQRERMPAADGPPCSWHHASDEGLLVVYPPQYRQWARASGLIASAVNDPTSVIRNRQPAIGNNPRSALRDPQSTIEIANPPSGAVYFIDPTLRREFQTLALRAVTTQPATIEWQINGRVVGTSSSESPLDWPLVPGTHRISARDERGHVAHASVSIK
jgi:penicillin-binding protein 1C